LDIVLDSKIDFDSNSYDPRVWEIAAANSRDRTIGGILPVWFRLGIAIGNYGFAIVSAGDLLSIRVS